MRIVQINSVCGKGSTGRICVGISQVLTSNGVENKILYAFGKSDYKDGIKFSNDRYIKIQALKSRLLGNYGFNSTFATKGLVSQLKKLQPDIVHLHNIHGHDCDLESLFEYLKSANVKMVWTFHDCWPFTGYCMYFSMCQCEKWKNGCHSCPQYKSYSCFFDKSDLIYQKKRSLFTGLDLVIVAPSKWLAGLVKESFLHSYPVYVINNGIDLNVFKPTESNFRKEYNCVNKIVLLGVAFNWDARKGLDFIINISKMLDSKYQIVLVGTNAEIDRSLPDNIISIHRSHNAHELAGIYSAADIFINPTREDNFPTVNIESLACGTPVLTFQTGGSPEIIEDNTGIVVPCENEIAFINGINTIVNSEKYKVDSCIARADSYGMYKRFNDYLSLYLKLMGGVRYDNYLRS